MKDKPIHTSVVENQIEKLKKYLKDGEYIDVLGKYDCTPLHYACREGNLEIVEFLIKYGADINKKNRYATYYPIIDALTSSREKELFPIIILLIDAGADINSIDSFGNTVLHYAVEQENIDLVELFLKLGCDVNQTLRHDRDTILHYACFQKNREIISKLIENGANREVVNIYNKNPESYL